MKNVFPKVVIGSFLTLGIWLVTLFGAKKIEGGLSPVPSLILTLIVWSFLFTRKAGSAGESSIDFDSGGDS